MQRADFHYELPDELIARYPSEQRSDCRLLCVDGQSGALEHRRFPDLLELLEPGDLLVFNDTRVIPARLFGHKSSGGRVEVLIERLLEGTRALAHVRASKSPKPDTGLVFDGYFCDFDRNFSLGPPSSDVQSAHSCLIDATQAAFDIAKPGATISDLFHAMNAIVNPGAAGSEAGRLGHGLGMQLTEWPSIIAQDHTVLQPGMVLTLEPGIQLGENKLMVHEENIVIHETGADYLSTPQAAQIRVI